MDYSGANVGLKNAETHLNLENTVLSDAQFSKTDKRFYYAVKRIFDVCASLLALIILMPLMIAVAAAIRFDSKGNVIYSQERVGKNGKIFKMFKFRSMIENADEMVEKLRHLNEMDGPVFKISNDPRITKIGRFIRKTSIDELPQLINIIKGDMSIVGPRPPLPDEVSKYTEFEKRRLSVAQGLTCYWQISGRSSIAFHEWIQLDLKYIKEQCIITDIKIIFLTIAAVIKRKGAY